jgi:hypothetical protein
MPMQWQALHFQMGAMFAPNHAKIPFTLVRNEVGSPSMHQLNEPPWRVEATYQLPRLEKERVHIDGVTLPWRVGFTPH